MVLLCETAVAAVKRSPGEAAMQGHHVCTPAGACSLLDVHWATLCTCGGGLTRPTTAYCPPPVRAQHAGMPRRKDQDLRMQRRGPCCPSPWFPALQPECRHARVQDLGPGHATTQALLPLTMVPSAAAGMQACRGAGSGTWTCDDAGPAAPHH
eukprot:365316-Chlamydomonas_euryale.AAC.7